MIGLASLRWVLTAAFGAASAFHLLRVLRPVLLSEPVGENRVSEALHLFMGVSMVAMIWPWGDSIPALIWVAVFTAGTGWFVLRALRSAGSRFMLGMFASSMAAMAWMGASMPAQASAGHRYHLAMGGMSMSSGRLGVSALISGALGGYLVVTAFWWLLRGLRLGTLATAPDPGERPPSWSAICHGLMSAAMGLALLAMA
jgi:hypothetical protein